MAEKRAVNPVGYLHTGILYCEDNLVKLREFPDDCIDLVYLDPPFFSHRHYEVIWGDEAEIRSFEDRWKGGIHEYVGWMRDRLIELHRALRPTGTLYLHCDWHASHYLKIELDRIFGPRNFLNEIIWCYDTGGRARGHFPRKHDTIFRYGKTKDVVFNYDAVALARDPTTMHEAVLFDEDGKPYQRNIKAGKEYRYYMDKGVLPNDWWTDLQALNPAAKERLGWPTQKPEVLLERIIAASSNKHDIVLDPFCGCGTTVAVAHQMQRQWIGIDVSNTAINIVKNRVDGLGASADTDGLPHSLDDLRKLGHFEFQNWVVDFVQGVRRRTKSRDFGIDGYTYLGRDPIQVKQSERVGRNAVDNFETAIERDHKEVGYLVAFSFTRDAYEEAARSREIGRTSVHLVRVEDILSFRDLLAAARAGRTRPDTSGVVDLMGFFDGAIKERDQRRARSAVSAADLFKSVARERETAQR